MGAVAVGEFGSVVSQPSPARPPALRELEGPARPRSLLHSHSALGAAPGLGPGPRPHWHHVLSLPGAGQ